MAIVYRKLSSAVKITNPTGSEEISATSNGQNVKIDIDDLKTYVTSGLGGGGGSGTVTNVSVTPANGLTGTVANASTTPAITLGISVTGMLKGTGTAITNAVAGTDYAPPTSGSAILAGNNAGGFSNVTVGSGLSFTGGTLSATGGGGGGTGTVTDVSIANANGFSGTVTNPTTTPAITLRTTVAGLLKSNGTALSAAAAGTDYAVPTSGTSILSGNGSGGFSNVNVGSGLSFVGGTLSATGGGGGSGETVPVTQTATTHVATSWPSNVICVYIQGYWAVGEGGFHVRRTMSEPAHPWKFRSADRFRANGTIDATNGGWWEGVTVNGRIGIECFGGKGDNSTDNLTAFNNFKAYNKAIFTAMSGAGTLYGDYGYSPQITLTFGPGIYVFSNTIIITETISMEGLGNGLGGSAPASTLKFPADTGGIIICGVTTPNGYGSTSTSGNWINGAGGTIIKGLCLLGSYTKPLRWYSNGIWLRARATIDKCIIKGFGNHGICIRGSAAGGTLGDLEGNINGFMIRDCDIRTCGYHGIYMKGADSNAGTTFNNNIVSCGGSGICDASFLGNTHFAPQAETCGWSQGGSAALPTKSVAPLVKYGSNYFYCIADMAHNSDLSLQRTPPPNTATDNAVWALADLSDPGIDDYPQSWLSPTDYTPVWGQVQDDDNLVYTVVAGQEANMWVNKPSTNPATWGTGVAATGGVGYLQWAKCARMAAGTGDTFDDYKMLNEDGSKTHMAVGPYIGGGTFTTKSINSGTVWINPYSEGGQWPYSIHIGYAVVIGGIGTPHTFRKTQSGSFSATAMQISNEVATTANIYGLIGKVPKGTMKIVNDASSPTYRGIMPSTDSGSNVVPVFYDGTNWRYM